MEYYGYAGSTLYIDLSTGDIKKEAFDPDLMRRFNGGWGMGMHLTARHLPPDTDPLSPENPIVITTAVFNGTPIPSSGKFQLVTKMANPANLEMNKHTVAAGSSGSRRFAPMLKFAGYDHLVITGRAPSPVYITIEDDEVKICPADDLWKKKDIYETTDELRKRHGDCGVIAIGKGGENLVNHSLIITDKRNSLARYGGATNMGYKRIKGIVTRGTKNIKYAHPDELTRMVKEDIVRLSQIPDLLKIQAETCWNLSGTWKTYYPPECYFDTLIGRFGCSSCPIACRTVHEIRDGEFAGTVAQTSQFMLAPIYGRRLELTDYRATLKLMDVCNRLGICFTTTVAMVKFLTRLYERGVIDEKKTDGLRPKMGDIHFYITLAEKIAQREGIGDVMARGWYALSAELGVNAWEDPDGDSIVKGTSCLFDGRFTPMEGVRFENVVNPRGGHHLHPVTYLPNKTLEQIRKAYESYGTPHETIERSFTGTNFNVGRLHPHLEDWEVLQFSMGICFMASIDGVYNLERLTRYYHVLTGMEIKKEELKRSAEVSWNLYKLLNVREGFDRRDDVIPELWRQTVVQPIKTSKGEITIRDYFGNPLSLEDLKRMQDDYYDERGWDIQTGIPKPEKVKQLGLDGYF